MFSKKPAPVSAPSLPAAAIGVRAGVVAGGVLGLYALYYIIWWAVSAAVGLAILGAIALGGFAILSMLPLLGQMLENWVLKMRKAAARANPVEQLQNIFILRTKQVDGQRQAAKAMNGQIRTLEQMVAERKAANKDTGQQEAAVGALKTALTQRIAKIKDYDKALVAMKDKIEDVEFQQKFSKIHAEAQATGGSAEDEATNAMLASEAINSSNDSFNQIFADLDVDTATLNETKQLEYAPGHTLDLQAINVPTLQPARA